MMREREDIVGDWPHNESAINLERGPVPSDDVLSLMTKRAVMPILRTAAPGGGYVLSSSNSWYTDAKFENCLAMVDAGRKYGRYPISVRD